MKRKDAKITSGRGKRGAIRAADSPTVTDSPALTDSPGPMAPAHLGVAIRKHWQIIALALITLLFKSLIFAPISIWPLAFVCLAPWVIGVGTASEARRVYVYSYLLGLAFFLINLRWLYVAAELWYAPMAAYLAVYFPLMACPLRHVVRRRRLPLGIVLPIIWTGGEMLRAVVLSGFPWFFLSHSLYEVLTLIQIADLVGAYGVSFLVAAINGAVADVVLALLATREGRRCAARSGATGGLPARDRGIAFRQWHWQQAASGSRHARVSVVFASVLLVATCIYGRMQLRADTSSLGPRIAVIQGDYLNSLSGGGDNVGPYGKKVDYLDLMAQASQHHPDLYLLPESAWSMYLNVEFRNLERSAMNRSKWLRAYFRASLDPARALRAFLGLRKLSRTSFEQLQSFARQNNAYVVAGAGALFPTPYDLLSDVRNYNSAFVFAPGGGEPERYDKRHLVYFGEIIPFRFGRLRPLYFWLNAITPFSGEENSEFSLFPGESFRTLSMRAASQNGQDYRFGTLICYEDVMPYVSRSFTKGGVAPSLVDDDRLAAAPPPRGDATGDEGGKQVDFLLNISNDGWFGRGGQQAQHLAICVMRAVENRVGIARSVNTGVSGFIDPSGRLHDLVGVGPDGWPIDGWPIASAVGNTNGLSPTAKAMGHPSADGFGFGYAVSNIVVDSRFSIYSRYGDWFAWTCAALWLLFYSDYFLVRALAGRARRIDG